jgi:phosphatidylethanolamine/phosphatidyl-N-methylethanolamine N-methyltransferase
MDCEAPADRISPQATGCRRLTLIDSDVLPFFRALISNPLRVSAIAPSSKALASAITAEIAPDHAPVIELGPGTGIFTRALLARGIPEDRLVLVEADPRLASLLGARFPKARVLNLDAALLATELLPYGEAAGAVVSGLPLLSIAAQNVAAILKGAFACLRPDGVFYQFTYRPRCPVQRETLHRLGLVVSRSHMVLWNLPPAVVYRFTLQRTV